MTTRQEVHPKTIAERVVFIAVFAGTVAWGILKPFLATMVASAVLLWLLQQATQLIAGLDLGIGLTLRSVLGTTLLFYAATLASLILKGLDPYTQK